MGSPRAYARAAAALAAEEAERRANIEAAAKELPDLGMCQPCGPRQPSLPPNGGVRFLAGPAVRHGELSFCFVYKFRQRFGVVADAIARQLGRETDQAVEACRKMNMFLDDLSCCKAACGESC